MPFRIDQFNSGRGTFNRRGFPGVMITHFYAPPTADTFAIIKTAGYFDDVAEDLIVGDLIWAENPTANPRLLTVSQVTVPVEIQEIQITEVSAILTTVGGAAVESFGSGIGADSIPGVSINTTGVGGLTILKQRINAGQVEVTFSADPGAGTLINLTVHPSLI